MPRQGRDTTMHENRLVGSKPFFGLKPKGALLTGGKKEASEKTRIR